MDKFEQAGYGQRDIGFGSRPALIMVDFSVGLYRRCQPHWTQRAHSAGG